MVSRSARGAIASCLALWGGLALLTGARAANAPGPVALVAELDGAIGPGAVELVDHALARAEARRARLLVLRLDTPGGLGSSTRAIVGALVGAPVPVVVHVAPAGARAASAGTFLVYAAHVAAMAPGTNLGAATPIPLVGGEGGEGDTGASKAVEDAAAALRSLAELRGRDAEWAEQAVREGASLTAREALARGVIDVVASDLEGLLEAVDGRVVSLDGRAVRLDTGGLAVERLRVPWRTRFLQAITDPNLAVLLVVLGVLGLAAEVAAPGSFGPGVLGAVALLLGLYGLDLLSADWAGLALLLLGLGLMVAEAFAPSFGLLGVAGIGALIAGALLLFRGVPGLRVAPWALALAALASAALLAWIGRHLWRSRRTPSATGAEGLIGARATVLEWSGAAGWVHVHGERWRAAGPQWLAPGDPVEVREVDGLTLRVTPAATAPRTSPSARSSP